MTTCKKIGYISCSTSQKVCKVQGMKSLSREPDREEDKIPQIKQSYLINEFKILGVLWAACDLKTIHSSQDIMAK